MIYLKRFLSKCMSLLRRKQVEKELEREITAHLGLLEEDFLRRGMNAEDARRAARQAYGGVEQAKQMHRDERSILWFEQLCQDIRYAIRHLGRSPIFAITIILTIALGIGANTAIFTLVHAILMKSLPVGDPKSLYRIGDAFDDCCLSSGLDKDNGDFDIFSYENYRHLRETTPEFEQLAAMEAGQSQISVRRASNAARSERSEYVSGNYFTTFGVGAFAGRVLTDADDKEGAAPAVVMSYQAWQAEYAGDPSVIGATFYLQNQPVTVVGIAPPAFYGDRISANPPAFWIPLSIEPLLGQTHSILHQPVMCWLYLLGRIKPGVAVGPLQQKISANVRQWLITQPDYMAHGFPPKIPKVHVVLTPGGAGIGDLQQQTSRKLYLLLSISALVLLVACANVANLMLARGVRQKAETSVRMALGSARSRLIRQMLTESVLLGCLGGLAGLAVAYAGTRAILALAFPDSLHSAIHATPSLAVLGFASLLSLMTGVLFGIVPAWVTSHADPAEALRGVSRSTGDRTSLPQKSLVVFQAAFSLVLLVGAGLLTKSLVKMEHQDFGLQTDNRYVLHLDPTGAGYKPENLEALYRALEQQFAAIPGMHKVGLALYSPLDGNQWDFSVVLPGQPAAGPNDDTDALLNRVSPDFFAAIGQPVIRGRGFTQSDTAHSQLVAVVNQAFVNKFFPNKDPIGRHFGIYEQEDIGAYEIVGVVANAKYVNPQPDMKPMLFQPLSQWQHHLTDPPYINLETQMHYITSIVMYFNGSPQNLEAAVRRTLANVDPNLAMVDLRSLDLQLEGNFNQERLIARLTTLFGLLTLVLTSIGLYGITSYQTAQRTREVGLRMAFGASRSRVVMLVMRGAFFQIVLGLALGIPIALIGAHSMADELFVVKSYDPESLLAAVLVLLAAAALAGFIPARRAASIDPMRALRNE
ncbi:MAG TPA: ABC transporter permease [Alloacidobacterium sp.]|nr:ABC transporter permease [Alloacidobacterium sp.]